MRAVAPVAEMHKATAMEPTAGAGWVVEMYMYVTGSRAKWVALHVLLAYIILCIGKTIGDHMRFLDTSHVYYNYI